MPLTAEATVEMALAGTLESSGREAGEDSAGEGDSTGLAED